MKKFLITTSIISIFISGILPSTAFAVDVSLGASSWYTTLDKKNLAGNGYPESTYKSDPVLMYGPVLGLKFSDNWSFTSAALYNTTEIKSKSQSGVEQKINRLDSDNLLNYSLNRYIKIFGGLKYQYIDVTTVYGDAVFWDAGPGFGAGVTVPVIDNLYLIMNVSGMYTWGKYTYEANSTYNSDLVRYGYNLAPNLAYYIEQLSLTVSAGYRYQVYRSDFSNSLINTFDNTFSGFTCSVVYNF